MLLPYGSKNFPRGLGFPLRNFSQAPADTGHRLKAIQQSSSNPASEMRPYDTPFAGAKEGALAD